MPFLPLPLHRHRTPHADETVVSLIWLLNVWMYTTSYYWRSKSTDKASRLVFISHIARDTRANGWCQWRLLKCRSIINVSPCVTAFTRSMGDGSVPVICYSNQSRKLSEIAKNFGRFICPPKFRGQGFQKLYPGYYPWLVARRMEKRFWGYSH